MNKETLEEAELKLQARSYAGDVYRQFKKRADRADCALSRLHPLKMPSGSLATFFALYSEPDSFFPLRA
jgi:hypothetical protein